MGEPEAIEGALGRWIAEGDYVNRATDEQRAAQQKLTAIRAKVEAVAALINERHWTSMRIGAIDAALRAERSALAALAPVGSVAPLEAWRAQAAEDAIRGALDRIDRAMGGS